MRHAGLRLGAFLVTMLASCTPTATPARSSHATSSDERENLDVILLEGKTGRRVVHIERADSEEERERGLMFRDHLPGDSGMLFLFPEESDHHFWMHETRIPLDMIFIDKEGRIVGIIHSARPMSDEILSAGKPSTAVLEVPGGTCTAIGLEEGIRISIP